MARNSAWVKIVSLAALFCRAIAVSDDNTLISTNVFDVQGFIDPAIPNVKKFLGIPYAEPPVGDLRWRPPQSKKAQNETVDATAFGDCCVQYNSGVPTVCMSSSSGRGQM